MARQRISEDGHKLTSVELNRRFQDKAASIDIELDKAFQNIDWKRREEGCRDLISFIKTYCVGTLLDTPPSRMGEVALGEMNFALSQSKPYQICLPRATGKTSWVECAMMYLLASGKRKFGVIVSQNARSAGNILKDCWRLINEKDTAFSTDFPELCVPFQVCQGSFRRRQTYQGVVIEKTMNAQMLQLPTITKDGEQLPNTGGILTVRGLSSGIRGLKVGRQRPDVCVCDDWQTAESAGNPEQVSKMLDLLRKDVMNLSSQGKLAVLFTSTPLLPDDLVEQLTNDVNWKTTKYKAVMSYPKNMKLWDEYFRIYDRENVEDAPHSDSLAFYKENRNEMDEGANLFNPDRFKESDGHISGLQAILEKRHLIGNSAFQAEYQMEPVKMSFSLDISPRTVVAKVNQFKRGEIPDGYVFVAASTDLNLSYALTTTIVAFKPDMTAVVVDHFISKANVDFKAPESEFNQQVHKCLLDHGKRIKSLGIKIDGWGIDANGTPFDAVTNFARQSVALCGVPAVAMAGKASHMFSGFIRSRLRDEVNGTLLCGDQAEHIKAGAGKKYMYWNSDRFREQVQKAFLAPLGSFGSLSLYDADKDEHTEFANQFCNEKLLYVKHRPDGRDEYAWKTAEPHDYLDATAQAFAIAASQGISGQNSVASRRQAAMKRQKIRPRLKIV